MEYLKKNIRPLEVGFYDYAMMLREGFQKKKD